MQPTGWGLSFIGNVQHVLAVAFSVLEKLPIIYKKNIDFSTERAWSTQKRLLLRQACGNYKMFLTYY